ncbi:helix-turn-helix domain-containing protein [Pseudalkalibacillus sp. NRS-1564]|uniref:helix-turn-helix domain-containing protein n=1 Tax=Pseudalkalibacillus sp. NRS-1564 TaxID=3233900 RepID=UPI003D2D181C
MKTTIRTTLTAKEAAQYIGISYWHLLDLAKKKQIPHIRAGKRVLFRVNSLEDWMNDQERTSVDIEEDSAYGNLRRIEI